MPRFSFFNFLFMMILGNFQLSSSPVWGARDRWSIKSPPSASRPGVKTVDVSSRMFPTHEDDGLSSFSGSQA